MQILVSGGLAPYTYSHSSGGILTNDSLLCSGIYDVIISDSQNDSLILNYVISSPLTTYNTYNYTDSTIIDTVLAQPVENCIVNYASIDTAYISNIVIYGTDSILITWTISSLVGLTDINQYYELPITNGAYSFVLDIFCIQKSTDNIFTFIDQYYFNSNALDVGDIISENIKVFKVYPNPFNNSLTIEYNDDNEKNFILFNINGKQVLTGKIWKNIDVLDLEILKSGIYILQIDTLKPVRIVKQ